LLSKRSRACFECTTTNRGVVGEVELDVGLAVCHTNASELAEVNHLVRRFEGEVPACIVTAAARAPDHRNIGDDELRPGREFLDFRRQHVG
jgi:hypothetical protein